MGADEVPTFTGVGSARENEDARATTDRAYVAGEASGGEKRDTSGDADASRAADADKRRRVGGLRLKAHVDMDAGK